MDEFIFILELIGTVAFASSGAMIAIEKKMDIFGVNVLGATTAVGGGIMRVRWMRTEQLMIRL